MSQQEWTLDTLERFLSEKILALGAIVAMQDERNKERFAAAKEQVALAHSESQKATTKAEDAITKRFDSVNEFRGALEDQSKDMLRRRDYDIQRNSLVEKIGDLTTRIATIEAAKIVTDPVLDRSLTRLTATVEKLSETRSEKVGQGQAVSAIAGGAHIVAAIFGALATAAGFAAAHLFK